MRTPTRCTFDSPEMNDAMSVLTPPERLAALTVNASYHMLETLVSNPNLPVESLSWIFDKAIAITSPGFSMEQRGRLILWISKNENLTTEQLDRIYVVHGLLPLMVQIVTLEQIATHPNTHRTTLDALRNHEWATVAERAESAWSVREKVYVY